MTELRGKELVMRLMVHPDPDVQASAQRPLPARPAALPSWRLPRAPAGLPACACCQLCATNQLQAAPCLSAPLLCPPPQAQALKCVQKVLLSRDKQDFLAASA